MIDTELDNPRLCSPVGEHDNSIKAVIVLQRYPATYPGSYAVVNLALCGTADRCEIMGWLPDQAPPTALPVPLERRRTATFVYLRDRAHGVEKAMWDCRRVKRDNPAQCLSPAGASPAIAGERRDARDDATASPESLALGHPG